MWGAISQCENIHLPDTLVPWYTHTIFATLNTCTPIDMFFSTNVRVDQPEVEAPHGSRDGHRDGHEGGVAVGDDVAVTFHRTRSVSRAAPRVVDTRIIVRTSMSITRAITVCQRGEGDVDGEVQEHGEVGGRHSE